MAKSKPLSVNAICKQCHCVRSTVIDWITRGVDGVRLKAEKIGVRWWVDQSDLDDFKATLTANSLPQTAPPIPEITNQRETKKRAEAAMDRLRKKGVPIS